MRRRMSLIIAMVALFIIGAAMPAAAHYVYNSGEVHKTSALCVDVRSETSHGTGAGYWRADAISHTEGTTWQGTTHQCAVNYERPPGYMAAKWTAYKWNGSEWTVCSDRTWAYNDATANVFRVSDTVPGSSPLCGNGHYGINGYGYVKLNGSWNGGGLWSGYHWLPA